MTLGQQLARSAGQQWARDRATESEMRDLVEQTSADDWTEWRIGRGHSVADFVANELPDLVASDQYASPRGSISYLQVDQSGDEAILPRTPVLEAFVEGALQGFTEDVIKP